MSSYTVPAGNAETELSEKRSRFLGHLKPVCTEEDAKKYIEEMRKQYRDARHNCWCYRIQQGDISRCSDDGEPSGTAGRPMLDVLMHAGVYNVCLVITRYFGGVLLGPGGLVRAYTKSAKITLDAAGVQQAVPWALFRITADYKNWEFVRRTLLAYGGNFIKTEYGENISAEIRVPEDVRGKFLLEISAGKDGNTIAEELGTALEPEQKRN